MSIKRNKKGGDISPSFNFAINTTDKSSEVQRYDYIPLDFIKAEVVGLDKDYFLNNEQLVFTPQLIDRDEIHYYYLIDENMKIKVYENNKIFISGSLHKYSNDGFHNYDSFTYLRFLEVVEKIKERFGIEPKHLRILCLEHGYNITPPIDPDLIIDHLIKHRNKDCEILLSNDRARYKQFKHNNYILKIYNKGKQYDRKDLILRIENKQTNWSEFRKNFGITTLEDFMAFDKTTFVDSLLTKWNDVLFYDPTIKGNDKYIKYRDVNFWNELRATVSRKTYCIHVNRLKELNATKGKDVQRLVSDLILEKAKSMRGGNVLQGFAKKYCKLTGIEIHNQRKESFLLSHQGLKYILTNDPDKYRTLEMRYLSGKWVTSSSQTKIKEIAHNIRTRFTRTQQRFVPNQLTIF